MTVLTCPVILIGTRNIANSNYIEIVLNWNQFNIHKISRRRSLSPSSCLLEIFSVLLIRSRRKCVHLIRGISTGSPISQQPPSCATKSTPCFWHRTRFSWAEISTPPSCLRPESGPPDYSSNASARDISESVSGIAKYKYDLHVDTRTRRVIISGKSATFRKRALTDIRWPGELREWRCRALDLASSRRKIYDEETRADIISYRKLQ